MSKINARSPYYITIGVNPTVANLTQVDMELYVYTGTQDNGSNNTRTNLFSLTSFAISNVVTFEISEIVRDYILNTFDGDYATANVWVDYRTTSYIQGSAQTPTAYTQLTGFDGYGFFEDGANPQNDSGLLQSNTKVVKLDDAPAVIPIDTSTTTQVTYELNGELVYTKAVTSSTVSTTQVEYVSNTINGSDEFEDRVIQDGGTFEGSSCLEQFANDFVLFDFDTIYVDTTDGVIKLTVDNIEECKYDPYKVTFVNKFGALQDLWFFKRTNEVLTTKTENFKRNIIVNGAYDTSRHQQKILTKNGSEKLTLNTGFYPEEYNEVFKQMQLSEDCWIEINSQTLPINVSSSSLNYKTHLNDKLINYTIEIDFAFDTINNIR
jgi:hypothetical protein